MSSFSAQTPTRYKCATPSPISVCFTGNNKAGSWKIRGEQLSACRTNWLATNNPTTEQIRSHDVFCFVKRPSAALISKLKRLGKPIIFDIVDSWAQPDDGIKFNSVNKARELFQKKWKSLGADAYIFPNFRMMADLGDLVPKRTYLYHHYHPSLKPIEVRRKASKIGYFGNVNFLGHWRDTIEPLCRKFDLEFVVNPESFDGLDLGFAARGGEHDSLLANRYKSNVKLANFYGAGIPCLVGKKETSYHETDNGFVYFFDSAQSLEKQLQSLLDYETRLRIHNEFLESAKTFEIEPIAQQFENFAQDVLALKQRASTTQSWFRSLRKLEYAQ